MERTTAYGVFGSFIATLLSIYLNSFNANFFLLILLPMWGMILGIAVGRVINLHSVPAPVPEDKPKETIIYQAKKKK